jgi:peptide/nickel transport system ATP-binding protein
MSQSILRVRNLRVVFPHRHGELVAIDDISFDVRKGEILGFVGESGAGKSMTGAAIIGLIDPPGYIERGEIWLDGERIDELDSGAMTRIRGDRISIADRRRRSQAQGDGRARGSRHRPVAFRCLPA